MLSMLIWPYTAFLASATKNIAGPTILLTRGMDSGTKCQCRDGLGAAHLIDLGRPCKMRRGEGHGIDLPSLPGGVTMTIFPTPATSAGMMFIRTEDG